MGDNVSSEIGTPYLPPLSKPSSSVYGAGNKGYTAGDQRFVSIQLHVNKRRRRRRGRKENASTLSKTQRVLHVLKYGKVNDYIHPREIDPFWGILYKQYEYLCYREYIYRHYLINTEVPYSDEDIIEMCNIINVIEKRKRELLLYMTNFMNLLYGSVLKNRFYGWAKKYGEEFISLFSFLVMKNLSRLQFDISKTRCSVYFYQMLWLGGIGLTKDISDRLKKEKTKCDEGNRGSSIFSYDCMEFDDYADGVANIDEMVEQTKFSADTVLGIIEEDEGYTTELVEFNEFTVEGKIDNSGRRFLTFVDDKSSEESAEESVVTRGDRDKDENTIMGMLKRLLVKLDIPLDFIYNASDKDINKLGKHIRKSLKRGRSINLTDEERRVIRNMFGKDVQKMI